MFAKNQQKKQAGRAGQTGQTLIETIVAIFILTTGLTSGLALAVYSFGTSSEVTYQITATGLAREGIEVIRRTRDSKWLSGTLQDCSSKPLYGPNQNCYPLWLTSINGSTGVGRAYTVSIATQVIFPGPITTKTWTINPSGAGTNYRLYYQADNTLGGTITAKPSPYYRKIIMINQNTATAQNEIQVLVRSVVWWKGKRCANISDYNQPSDTRCKIVSEEYLTNWRNY